MKRFHLLKTVTVFLECLDTKINEAKSLIGEVDFKTEFVAAC